MKMRRATLILAGFLLACLSISCTCTTGRTTPLSLDDLRGLPLETVIQMREDILAKHPDGGSLTKAEADNVALLRDQERRLENAWLFGEWRERHGSRLMFRDDGTVSVGARGGAYDELGVYKFISPEEPSYDAIWTLVYDDKGDPVVLIPAKGSAPARVYPFHGSHKEVREQVGDLLTAVETGFYYTKTQY